MAASTDSNKASSFSFSSSVVFRPVFDDMAPELGKWINDLKKRKFKEVPVAGIDSADTLSFKQGGDVCIGNQVSTDDLSFTDFIIMLPKLIVFVDETKVR